MTEEEIFDVLQNAKMFFRERFFSKNYEKISKISLADFEINPFLCNYLALVAGGDVTSLSIAKALVYPRIFGTSITTSFGTNVQTFLTTIGTCQGSAISGMDVEFVDALDGRKKYAQIKASKQTINKKDVAPLIAEFDSVRNLARTNRLDIREGDLLVGVLYGSGGLTPFYREIDEHYPVYMGQDFWLHLTGQDNFYARLISSVNEVAAEFSNANAELETMIQRIANEINDSTLF